MMLRRALGLTALALLLPLAGLTAQEGSANPRDGVQVTAKDFEFEMPRAIPSGWHTFRFVNKGEQEHFVFIGRLPDDKTFADYRSEVFDTFMEVFNRYDAAELTRKEASQALADGIPPWFVEEFGYSGGVGLTEPGRTSQATVHLEPGTYVVECYVKTPQGTFHNDRGMLRKLTVTEDSTGAAPPEPDVELTLSNYEIGVSGEFTPGTQTVAVDMSDTPEGLLPHDVNLFRFESDTTTVKEIVAWMDWMDLEQFRAPSPGISLGGIEPLPAGATGYLTVDLEPGRYAWVSELYGARGMVEEFTVE